MHWFDCLVATFLVQKMLKTVKKCDTVVTLKGEPGSKKIESANPLLS